MVQKVRQLPPSCGGGAVCALRRAVLLGACLLALAFAHVAFAARAHAEEPQDVIYSGDVVKFVKSNLTDEFGMFSNPSGDMSVSLADGKVHVRFTPSNQNVYSGFYLRASIADVPPGGTHPIAGLDDSMWVGAIGDAGSYSYDFYLDASFMGKAWQVAPVKTAEKGGGTTAAQYYLAVPVVEEGGAAPVETPVEKAKRLIAVLPYDPFKVTRDDAAAVAAAQRAFDALSDAERETLCDSANDSSICTRGQTYGRYLESARWALQALEPVDNSTSLADGTYTGQVSSATSMGLSNSDRKIGFKVQKVHVRNGRAYALLEHESDASDRILSGGIVYKNLNTGGSGHSVYEIPVDLNSTMYFSAMAKAATAETAAIAYELTTKANEASMEPDAPSADSGNAGSAAPAGQAGAAGMPGANAANQLSSKDLNAALAYLAALVKQQSGKGGGAGQQSASGKVSGQGSPSGSAARRAAAVQGAQASQASQPMQPTAEAVPDDDGAAAAVSSTGGYAVQAQGVEEDADAAQARQDAALSAGIAAVLAALAGAAVFTAGFVRAENRVRLQ